MRYLAQYSHGWPVGSYRLPANCLNFTASAPSTAAKRTFLPFVLPDVPGLALSEIGLDLRTAQTGAECRLGLWDDDNGVPGELLQDFGVLSLSSGSGWVKIDTTYAPPTGAVWASCDLKNVATQVTVNRMGSALPGFVNGAVTELTGSVVNRYFEQSITYGSALPSTAGAVIASTGADCPIIAMRRGA